MGKYGPEKSIFGHFSCSENCCSELFFLDGLCRMEPGYAIGSKETRIYGVQIQAECIRRCILRKEKDDSTIDAVTYVYANKRTYCQCISGTTNILSIYDLRFRSFKNSLINYFDPKSYACSPKRQGIFDICFADLYVQI